MRSYLRYSCISLILAALLLNAACGEAREAAAPPAELTPTPAATATAAPTATPTPSPSPTPLLTEYAVENGATWEQVETLLNENPALQKLDLRDSGLDVREHPAMLKDLAELRFTATLCGAEITDETEVFVPLTAPEEWDLETLQLLKGLKTIDLTATDCEPERIGTILERFPDQEVLWKLTLCGTEVGPDTEALNYNDQPIESLEPFYRTLPLLTKLTSLEMCGCGVGNEDMDALRTAFPQAGIVWSIKTEHWTVRTDADHFASWKIIRTDENGKILEARNVLYCTNADLDWLQYCHDIIALDVGHNKLTNIEFVRNMPKLKYLITSGNDITDISPVSELHELVYFELFADPVTDLGPLSGLTNLLDINICSCPVSDLSPLYDLTQLERLWLTPYGFTDWRASANEFSEHVPDCDIHFVVSHDMTGDGWRRHPRYDEYRLALGRAKP